MKTKSFYWCPRNSKGQQIPITVLQWFENGTALVYRNDVYQEQNLFMVETSCVKIKWV